MIDTDSTSIFRACLALSLSLAICGCARGTGPTGSTTSPKLFEAQQSDILVIGITPGATPFIASVEFTGQSISDLDAVEFSIAPKPNSVSKAINVTWDRTALASRGYLQTNSIQLPVFGLYDGYQNQVTFQLQFNDRSVKELEESIQTEPYTDPLGIYESPTILKARPAGSNLGFDFLYLKSTLGSPVIVDTDGNLRWTVPIQTPLATPAQYFEDGEFTIGSAASSALMSLQFDGALSVLPTILPQPLMQTFTHNIDPGPSPENFLAEFSGVDDLGTSTGSIVAIVSPNSSQPVIETFDLADILTSYMRANGDDPTNFVRPGVDWFHVNASVYDPSDNSVIVSSRENFLIKINCDTKEIVWIFGDPRGYWYTLPSLRAKALTLDPGADYPVGQHGVSITSDGYLMVFNDGAGSANQPTDNGFLRGYSEVNAYSVNAAAMSAHQIWVFDYGQSIFSQICGSSYEAPGHTYLVDFAAADNRKDARLVGLDSNHNVVFDFRYLGNTCSAAWNALPINLDDMEIE